MAREKLENIEKMIKEDAESIEIDEEFKKNLKNRILASGKISVSEQHTAPNITSIGKKIKEQGHPRYLRVASILVSLFITGSIATMFNKWDFQKLFVKNKSGLNSDIANFQIKSKFNDDDENKDNYKAYNDSENTNSELKKEGILSVENNEKSPITVGNSDKAIKNIENKKLKPTDNKSTQDDALKETETPTVSKEEEPLVNNIPQIEDDKILVEKTGDFNRKYAFNGKIAAQEFKIKSIEFNVQLPNSSIINNDLNLKNSKKSIETNNSKENNSAEQKEVTQNSKSNQDNGAAKDNGVTEVNGVTEDNEVTEANKVTKDKKEQEQQVKALILVRNSTEVSLYDKSHQKKYVFQKSLKEIQNGNKQLEMDFEKLFGEKTVYSFLSIDIDKNGKEIYLTVVDGENKKRSIKLDAEGTEKLN